jgi:hypothetical protein
MHVYQPAAGKPDRHVGGISAIVLYCPVPLPLLPPQILSVLTR